MLALLPTVFEGTTPTHCHFSSVKRSTHLKSGSSARPQCVTQPTQLPLFWLPVLAPVLSLLQVPVCE
jgi:hypothetical protein